MALELPTLATIRQEFGEALRSDLAWLRDNLLHTQDIPPEAAALHQGFLLATMGSAIIFATIAGLGAAACWCTGAIAAPTLGLRGAWIFIGGMRTDQLSKMLVASTYLITSLGLVQAAIIGLR